MTRKDYKRIARALNNLLLNDHSDVVGDQRAFLSLVTGALAQELKEDNPKFDKVKFYAAVMKV